MHAVAGEQGSHAAVPFAYVPTGHVDAVKAQEAAPCALKAPAAQGMQEAEEGAPAEVRYVPAGQAAHVEGAAAPTKALYDPAPQRVQVALEAAPVADDQVPAGQGMGSTDEIGQ